MFVHFKINLLAEVARLDTCVTVVDAAEFYNNLDSMKVYEEGEIKGTIAELMMEQVEFSNVVVLNKEDLVSVDMLNNQYIFSALFYFCKTLFCNSYKIFENP